MEENHYLKAKLNSAVIMGLSFIIGCVLVSQTFYKVRQLDNTLSVTGSTKQKVVSDAVKWVSSFSRTVYEANLKSGYTQMKNDEEKILAFLVSQGFNEQDIVISPVFMDQVYKYDSTSGPKEYNLRQTVELKSSEVQKVTEVSKNTQELINQEVLFSTQYIEYVYTKLPELRISLLAEAIKDAKARAEKIAESSGKRIDVIKSASIGVVQVLPVNSVEISDYGAYDTSSIEKEVMVTVKASFNMK
jgi:hypothetical protein